MIHNKNISRWVEFAPIDTYRIDGIGRRDMREKNIPTRPFTCGELVTKKVGEGFGEAVDDGYRVGFEGMDGALGGVVTMHIKGHELLDASPVFGDDTAVLRAGLVVEDLVINDVAALLDPGHDAGVGSNAMAVVFRLKMFDKDDIGVTVVGEHDVLIATVRSDGEATHIVGEELADESDSKVKFVGSGVGERAVDVNDGRHGDGKFGFAFGG